VWPFCQRKGFASGVIAAPSVGLRPGNGGDVGPLTRQLQGRAGDLHGRIVACGGISMYNDQKPRRGSSNLFSITTKRLTMKGLIVSDWLDRQAEFQHEVGGYLRAGTLKSKETLVSGIDQAVTASIGLFDGTNVARWSCGSHRPAPYPGAAQPRDDATPVVDRAPHCHAASHDRGSAQVSRGGR